MNWKPEITLGSLMSTATIIVGLTVGWQTLASETRASTKSIDRLEGRMTEYEKRFNDTLDFLAKERVMQTTIFTELRSDLRYMRETLDELKASKK